MAHVEVLSLASLLGTLSPRGIYILGYGWLYGMCKIIFAIICDTSPLALTRETDLAMWVSFFGGMSHELA
jgi:hypothetical protein